MSSLSDFDEYFEKWKEKNPDKPAYMFGFDLDRVPCRMTPGSFHIGQKNEVTCQCLRGADDAR